MAMTRLRQGARCVLRLPFVLLALLGLLLSVTATARWPSLQRRCLRWGSWTLCQAFSVRLPAPLALPASPQLIVVNHISWLDVVVLSALLPPALETRFLAKAEVGRWPVIGPFARGLGMAFIDRSSAFRSYRALPALAKGLQARSLLFFPEGTTTDGVGVAPLKPMGFELAARAPAVAVEVERLPALPAAPRKALARSVEEGLRAVAERRLAPRPPFRGGAFLRRSRGSDGPPQGVAG